MGDIADYLVHNESNPKIKKYIVPNPAPPRGSLLADQVLDHVLDHRARLLALYSDFRAQRTLNPDGFQANVQAWQRTLERATWDGRLTIGASQPCILVANIDKGLLPALEISQVGQPLALGTVVREAVVAKSFLPLQDFLRSKESIYHRSWTELPWNVVTWTLRKVWDPDSTASEDRLPAGRYVVKKNVEEAGRLLQRRLDGASSRLDRVFSRARFDRIFADTLVTGHHLSGTDLDVLLKFMSRDKGTIAYDGKIVKIKGSAAEDSIITEDDAAIASLTELIEDLERQTALLSKRVEELTATARDAVARKSRVQALAALKSKKLAETTLEKRYATLHQLEQVAHKIQEATDNVQLVRVMESSTGVLRSLNAQVGGAERVDEVMDRLREQMADVDEIGNVLADAHAGSVVIDEDEIDDELAALELLEKQKETEKKREDEAQAVKEAEATRERLATLEPPPGSAPELHPSPATETARELEKMELG